MTDKEGGFPSVPGRGGRRCKKGKRVLFQQSRGIPSKSSDVDGQGNDEGERCLGGWSSTRFWKLRRAAKKKFVRAVCKQPSKGPKELAGHQVQQPRPTETKQTRGAKASKVRGRGRPPKKKKKKRTPPGIKVTCEQSKGERSILQ